MYFFVKVRIDTGKLSEFGKMLQNGIITTHPLSTYCLHDDPRVGLNIWEAKDRDDFEKLFEPHRRFYSEVIEVSQVITPEESMKVILGQMTNKVNDKIAPK